MKLSLLVVGLVAAVSASCAGGSSSSGPASGTPTDPQLVVGCDQMLGPTRTPFADGYRRVLGAIAVAPPYIPQVVSTPGERWPYWEKSGMVVLARPTAVTVSVPRAWRRRAAITWGNGLPAVSSIRFAPCPSPPNVWNAYAGGFFLRSHGACIPLVFQVGHRRALVHFGIDRRCD